MLLSISAESFIDGSSGASGPVRTRLSSFKSPRRISRAFSVSLPYSTPIFHSTRRVGFCEMLLIVPPERAPFGRTIVLLSVVRSFVLTMLTSLTVPENPCASMKSPALNGLKTSSIIPPAKF